MMVVGGKGDGRSNVDEDRFMLYTNIILLKKRMLSSEKNACIE